MIAWVVTATLTLGATESALPAATAEGCVLGLRAKDGSLETVFVDPTGVTPLGRGLAVPRKAGWWRVDVVRMHSRTGPFLLAAAPATRKLPPFPLPRERGAQACDGENAITVHFVAPDWISFEETGYSECDGDLRPSIQVGSVTTPLDELALRPSERSGTGEAFATAIGPQLQKLVDARLPSAPGPVGTSCPPETGSVTALVRQRGRWVFQAEGANSASVCRGDLTRFTLDAPVPAALTGPDALPPAVEREVAGRDDVVDALTSPGGALTILVTRAGLEVRAPGKPPSAHALPERTVVMAQWAVGARHVERWRRDARSAVRP